MKLIQHLMTILVVSVTPILGEISISGSIPLNDITNHKVFFLGGQSNMAGEALITDEVRRIYQSDVEVFCGYPSKFEKDREEYLPNQTTPSWQSFRACGSNDNFFGPEITFGEAMAKAYPDTRIYLIKYAHGGTSLGCEWQPNERSSAFIKYGDVECKNYLLEARKDLSSIRTYSVL
jgi:hypothetical protein